MALEMERKMCKQNALSLKTKLELLQVIYKGNNSKTETCNKFGIPNSTLSMIIKNQNKIVKNHETIKCGPDGKCLRMANYENLEATLLVWFKQARFQNAPVSSPLLMEKADVFAGQMGL
jgi:hypothetical protein